MNDTHSILEHYRRADPGTRLYMLMEHRDLRHLFEQIETEEQVAEDPAALRTQPRTRCWGTAAESFQRLLRGCCARRV